MQKLPEITPEIANQVWLIPSLDQKKVFLLDYIGGHNTVNQGLIRNKIVLAKSANQINTIVTNMLLATEKLSVK